MPSPEQAEAISRLGAFALFVLITLFGIVALWKRWIVISWFYEDERAKRLTADTQAERNSESLKTLSEVLKALQADGAAQTVLIAALARKVTALEKAVRNERLRNGRGTGG